MSSAVGGKVTATVELVPLVASGSRRGKSLYYRDILSASTNKSVTEQGAGSFEVVLALPHGYSLLLNTTDNDLLKLYAGRGLDMGDNGELLYVGQIDRMSRTWRPDHVEWTIRGKCLTKQFLTNVIYLPQFTTVWREVSKSHDETIDIESYTPSGSSMNWVANMILGCTERITVVRKDADNNQYGSMTGIPVQCFLEKLMTESVWVDRELLMGLDIQAQYMVIPDSFQAGWLTVYELLNSLADWPHVHQYVDELGVFHFKRWQWRNASPQVIVDETEFMNENTSVSDFKVIAGCQVNSLQGFGSLQVGIAIAYNGDIGQRYGTRFQRLAGVPYLYDLQATQQRARDQIQMQYLGRIESTVTCRGSAKFHTDTYAFVPRIGGYFYIDSVQHRLNFAGGEGDWTTTLGLTHGRPYPDSFISSDAGEDFIKADLARSAIVPKEEPVIYRT